GKFHERLLQVTFRQAARRVGRFAVFLKLVLVSVETSWARITQYFYSPITVDLLEVPLQDAIQTPPFNHLHMSSTSEICEFCPSKSVMLKGAIFSVAMNMCCGRNVVN